MVSSVEQTMAMATAMRARLDDRIGFNFNDLMMTESMLPEEQEMLRYSSRKNQTMEAAESPFGGSEVKTGLQLEDDLSGQLKRTRTTELTGNLLYIND